MSRNGKRVERALALIFAFLGLALLFGGNSAFATSFDKAQRAPMTVVGQSMILAALSDVGENAKTAPTVGRSSPGALIDNSTVVPRSEWIRVAPLVVKRCCGGYTCDERSGTCVCKAWCN
jgi:hypothetical protein